MVIMWSTFSLSGWHVESPESQETADDKGLGLGQGSGADWAALHQGRGEELCCGAYQQPDAWGEKSPLLRRQITVFYKIHAVEICQSTALKLVLWSVLQEAPSWTMIWMQYRLIPLMVKVWHACKFPKAHLQQQYETMPGLKYPQTSKGNSKL